MKMKTKAILLLGTLLIAGSGDMDARRRATRRSKTKTTTTRADKKTSTAIKVNPVTVKDQTTLDGWKTEAYTVVWYQPQLKIAKGYSLRADIPTDSTRSGAVTKVIVDTYVSNHIYVPNLAVYNIPTSIPEILELQLASDTGGDLKATTMPRGRKINKKTDDYVEFEYRTVYDKGKYITISDSFTNRKDGESGMAYITFDLSTGKRLQAADIFKSKDFTKVYNMIADKVANATDSEFTREQFTSEFLPDYIFNTSGEYSNWTSSPVSALTDDGVTFSIPTSAGNYQIVTLPYGDIAHHLNPTLATYLNLK